MSRSVETIGSNVIYFHAGEFQDDWDWEDLELNLQCELKAKYKSLVVSEKWVDYPYRENQIFLENYHIQLSISEYTGCGAISVFIARNCEYPELAEHWLEQNFDGIEKIIVGFVTVLRRVATFSNGEAVFEKK